MVHLQAKIQELAEHVPKGHIPRTMTVHFRGELTRKVRYFLPIGIKVTVATSCFIKHVEIVLNSYLEYRYY